MEIWKACSACATADLGKNCVYIPGSGQRKNEEEARFVDGISTIHSDASHFKCMYFGTEAMS